MLTLLILLLTLACSLLIHAGFLWLGARWAKVPQVRFRVALGAVLLIFLTDLALAGLLAGLGLPGDSALLAALTGLALQLLLSWWLIKLLFRTTFARAALVWLAFLPATGVCVAFVFLIVKPFVLEAFIVPAGAMAPTLIGPHYEAICPQCGRTMVLPGDPNWPDPPGAKVLGICTACMRIETTEVVSAALSPPDRFFCNRLHVPRRWDVIVFRFPQDPARKYAMRLVALPGEEVVIKEGAVWINGAKQVPPPHLASLPISGPPDGWVGPVWGTSDQPAKLGEDEYFVLGDFAPRSADSRMWEKGAGGHPPFAVPRSHVESVVTMIYWPVVRWRVFR